MTAVQRFSIWSVVVSVFIIGGFAAGAGERQKVDELIGKLGERDWQNAVDALAKIGEPAVESLILTLRDRSVKTWIVHARAVNTLAKIGSQRAVEAVVKSVEDAGLNQYVRGLAVLAVAEIKPKEAAEVLSRVSRDKNQFVRWKCAQALGILGKKEGTDTLVRILSDEDKYVRAAAARSLGQVKSENAGDDLINALKDEHWLVRLNVREALLQIGEAIDDRLIAALKDKNSSVRWQTACVLGRIKSDKAIKPLIEALADADWMVRDEAAVALTKFDSGKVTEPLGDALNDKSDYIREGAGWILDQIKSNRVIKEEPSRGMTSRKIPPEKIYCGQNVYPCYPATLDAKPDIPSPYTTLGAVEVVTAFTKEGKYVLVPVTVENGKPLNYKQNQWGKGRQLEVDADDFPTLARTGLHSDAELSRTKMITGRSIVEIAELGRPGRSSGAGFMSDDEDIISILRGDNYLVMKLGLRHPQTARPLFHIWNMIVRDVELNRLGRFWEHFEYILYNGQKVFLKGGGSKGWQESLFDDEILGKFQIEIWREPNQDDKAFLLKKYPDLANDQMAAMLKKLSHIYTGEMVPYYIMRYGFYEGHTDYRADPVAIAWIFGLKSLEQIEAEFDGRLEEVLTQHFTREAFTRN